MVQEVGRVPSGAKRNEKPDNQATVPRRPKVLNSHEEKVMNSYDGSAMGFLESV
jgi:hypothetical protein